MPKSKKDNIWYFYGTGIGGFLLALNTVENAYFRLDSSKRGQCFVVTLGNTFLYEQLAAQYPHIKVVRFNKDDVLPFLKIFYTQFWKRNLIIHAPSFGKLPRSYKLASFFLRVCNRQSRLVGYDASDPINRFLYTDILYRDYSLSVFNLMNQAVDKLLPDTANRKFLPQLIYEYSSKLAADNPEETIIFHPFPSNPKRGLPLKRNIELIKYIRNKYPSHRLILSGGPENREEYDLIQKSIADPDVSFICDLGNFIEQVQLVALCTQFIGVDTGITHIAAVLKKDMVVIGNRTNPSWLPTYNPSAKILYSENNCGCNGNKTGKCEAESEGKKYFACIFNIEDADVHKAIDAIIQ